MWKLFSQNESDPTVYLKVETLENKGNRSTEIQPAYKISVTNYIKMWSAVYDNDRIIQMMLNSNKGTENEDTQSFLDAGLQLLCNPKMLHVKVFTETQSGNLSVRLACKTPIVLRMNFTLMLCTPEQFFRFITLPLLEVINDLQSSEKKLRQHLIKKDQEIKGFMDMLPEGSPLMRCLRTEPYNDVKHMSTHSIGGKLFGTDPVEVSPEHILHGHTLLVRADELDMDNSLSDSKHMLTTNSNLNSIYIKQEPASENQTLHLQIPAIKTESKENMNIPNTVIKNEPNDANGPNESNNGDTQRDTSNKLGSMKDIKDESSDCKDDSNSHNHNIQSNSSIYLTEDKNNVNEINDNQIKNDANLETVIAATQLITTGIDMNSETNDIKKQLTHSSASMCEDKPSPKKKRKKLNY